MKNRNLIFGALLTSTLFALDRVLKIFAPHMDYSLLNGFFELIYRQNKGIAFSLPIPVWASILITAALIGFGLFFVMKNFNLNKKIPVFSAALILTGALGNIYDRIFLGYVVDYISIWKWPVFNFADMCIFAGAAIVVLKWNSIVNYRS